MRWDAIPVLVHAVSHPDLPAFLAASAAAEGTPSTGEILSALGAAANLGVLGVVFWLLVVGRLHTEAEVAVLRERAKAAEDRADRAEDRADRAEEKRADEIDRIVPILAAFNQTTAALLPIMQANVAEQRRRRGSSP